jgi:DnaK suppressor protein
VDAFPKPDSDDAPFGQAAPPTTEHLDATLGMDPGERLAEVARRLEAIEVALERVADGSYGLCESCGCELEEDLLNSHPTARRCPQCARAVLG